MSQSGALNLLRILGVGKSYRKSVDPGGIVLGECPGTGGGEPARGGNSVQR